MVDSCSKGHRRSRRCFEGAPSTCEDCEHAAKLALERKEKREAEERDFNRRMAELDAEIASLTVN